MKRSLKSDKSHWLDRMNPVNLPKVVEIPDKWARSIGHGTMAIVTPALIDKYVKKVPKGKLITVNQIRNHFADEFTADTTCPLTTGIFINIMAKAAEEVKAQGKKIITPYWRVVKEEGKLNPKYPGGVKKQAAYLQKEGFDIQKGKTDNSWKVENFQQFLWLAKQHSYNTELETQ